MNPRGAARGSTSPAARVRRFLAAVTAAGVAGALALPTAAPAVATDARTGTAAPAATPATGDKRLVTGLGRITSPSADSVVTAPGGAMTVRMSLRAGARLASLTLNGRDVTDRVTSRGSSPTAVLRVGTTLGWGGNVLVAEFVTSGQQQFARTSFTLVRPVTGLIRDLSPRAGTRLEPDPLPVSLRVRPNTDVRLWLNGSRATDRLREGRPGRWSASLSPSAGLRFGTNEIRVRAVHPSGQLQEATRTVRVRATAPLADAGSDRRGTAGRAVRLDGREALAVPGADPSLAYAWRIADAPQGSTAQLGRSRTSRPVLRAEEPGTYVLRATVRGARPAGGSGPGRKVLPDAVTAGVDAAGAVPTGGPAVPAAATVATSDTVTVTLNSPEVLVPVSVQGGSTPAVVLGPTTVPASSPGPGVQLVVLDRQTLAVQPSSATFVAGSMSGLQAAVADVQASNGNGSTDSLAMVVSLPIPQGGSVVSSSADQASLEAALAILGATAVDPAVPFGVVGIPGVFTAGQAWQVPAVLSGFFLPDINGNWTFAFGDDLAFDTGTYAPGSGNTMTVGGTTFTVNPPLAAGAGGFQVVVLDPVNPSRSECYYVPTNDPAGKSPCTTSPPSAGSPLPECVPGNAVPPCYANEGISSFSAILGTITQSAAEAGMVVLLRSIGSPYGSSSTAGPEAALPGIAAVGGTLSVFTQISSEAYALVGPTAYGKVPLEATSLIDLGNPTGRVTGTLSRVTSGGIYRPTVTDATAQTSYAQNLSSVAFADPVPWPASSSPGEVAALQDISQRLGLGCDAVGSDCDVRLTYLGTGFDPANYGAELAALGPIANRGYTDADFAAVQQQLGAEFPLVGNVWQWVESLQQPYPASGAQAFQQMTSIAGAVQSSVTPPPASQTGATVLGFITDALWGISLIGEGAFPEAAGALAVGAALGANLATLPNGAPQLNIQTTAQDLSGELLGSVTNTGDGIGVIGELLLSDWGKLKTLQPLIDVPGPWALESSDLQTYQDGVLQTVVQQFYESLMPAAYSGYSVLTENTPQPAAANFSCAMRSSNKFIGPYTATPFDGITQNGQLVVAAVDVPSSPPGSYSQGTLTYPAWALFQAGLKPLMYDPPDGSLPSGSLMNAIVAPADPGGANGGINGGFTFAQYFWDQAYPDIPSLTCPNYNG